MRWTRFAAVFGMVAATVASISSLFSCAPAKQQPAAPAAMTAEQKVERGRYLMSAMPCVDCHTPGTLYGAPDSTRMYSGSELGWVGPWGVAYAANLTSDSTGLAAWTEDQVVTAIRTGNRPDGRQLAPIMPWMWLSRLTDDDAHSLAAYIKTLPPVHHKVPAPVPPTEKAKGALVVFPPPPPWDAKNLPAPPPAAK